MNRIKGFIKDEIFGWKAWEIIWLLFSISVMVTLSLYWGDNFRGIAAGVTGVLCVILTGKGKMSCYLFGAINTILYAWIAFEARYYGEVMLNSLYYLPMQFVGWSMWKKHIDQEAKEVIKARLSIKKEVMVAIISIISVFIYGTVLKKMGGNLPYIDSMSTCLSVLAMILSVKRLMEQWVLWIVIDVITVYMWLVDYINGGSDVATLLMWSIYLINAIIMFWKWHKESHKEFRYEV